MKATQTRSNPLTTNYDELLTEYVEKFYSLPNTLFLPLSHELDTFGLLILQSDELLPEEVPAYTAFSYQLAAAWHKSNLLFELSRTINELSYWPIGK